MKDILRNITPEESIHFILNNKAVLFKWKNTSSINSGYIAQDILASGYEHLISTIENKNFEESSYGPEGKQYVLNYDGIIPYHSGAIKYLIEENNELKEKVKDLSTEVKDLSTKNNELSIEINKIKEILNKYNLI
jgi:hypothetical protein